jgi:hypothetical protein
MLKPVGECLRARSKRRSEDNIKEDHRERAFEDVK